MKWQEQSFGAVLSETLSLTLVEHDNNCRKYADSLQEFDQNQIKSAIEPNTGLLLAVEVLDLGPKEFRKCKVLSILSEGCIDNSFGIGSQINLPSSHIF